MSDARSDKVRSIKSYKSIESNRRKKVKKDNIR